MQHNTTNATEASAHYARAIRKLLAEIEAKGELKTTNVSWGNVGDLSAAHEALVNAAYHLGVLSAEDAKSEHGVTI